MSDQGTVSGSCRCGQVRITARGPAMMTFACHCQGCQRMSAGPYSLSALYPEAAVTIEGETVIGGLKSDDLQHYFCPSCMSWLFTRAAQLGPVVNLRSTLLEGGPADHPPFIETWTAEKRPWAETGAAHSYPGFPPPADFGALMAEFAGRHG